MEPNNGILRDDTFAKDMKRSCHLTRPVNWLYIVWAFCPPKHFTYVTPSRRFPRNRHKHVLASLISITSMHVLHLRLANCSRTHEIWHCNSQNWLPAHQEYCWYDHVSTIKALTSANYVAKWPYPTPELYLHKFPKSRYGEISLLTTICYV